MDKISEQVKELRDYSKLSEAERIYNTVSLSEMIKKMNQAANTIETLYAKLQAENMKRTEDKMDGKSILEIETPKYCFDCPCHFAGESGMVVCGVEKRELLSDDIETFKPDWCPLRESAEDCGGWIPCKERLPEEGQEVLLQDYYGNREIGRFGHNEDYQEGFYSGDWFSTVNNYLAWHELPEPYHEP